MTIVSSGAAFRTSGPVEDILFEDCLSNNNAGGFQMKDGANMTVAKATVPPKAGNDGYASDLPEEQWSSWPGWDFASAQSHVPPLHRPQQHTHR